MWFTCTCERRGHMHGPPMIALAPSSTRSSRERAHTYARLYGPAPSLRGSISGNSTRPGKAATCASTWKRRTSLVSYVPCHVTAGQYDDTTAECQICHPSETGHIGLRRRGAHASSEPCMSSRLTHDRARDSGSERERNRKYRIPSATRYVKLKTDRPTRTGGERLEEVRGETHARAAGRSAGVARETGRA
ncbi:hypothetical protein BC628DRAFT_578687 [Trametes gibbosa]|nr:hypothetical protein BC628DRAFT_578687 [Trametes gibbosa]